MAKPRWVRLSALISSLGVLALLWWWDRGNHHSLLVATISLLVISALVNVGVIELPVGVSIPFVNLWPKLPDFAKAVVSFACIFVWSPLALRVVPDSNLGMIVVLAPDVLFLFLALLFISNGLSRRLK